MQKNTSIALHRFGLGPQPEASSLGDALTWLQSQIAPAPRPRHANLINTKHALRLIRGHQEAQKSERMGLSPAITPEAPYRYQMRRQAEIDLFARWENAVRTTQPFTERLVHFWTNHFNVSGGGPILAVLQGPFEREAIRPNLAGNFADLLFASSSHPAMLLYLDNAQSIGPSSQAGMRQARGLNENLAREILELHSLGVRGGYTQRDIIELAKVLTGWTIDYQTNQGSQFTPRRHQPGSKTILGKFYPDGGPDELRAVLKDLALHPSTATFLATKLARHFVADEPPPAVVHKLRKAYLDSGGDLATVYRALLNSPEAWRADFPKLKTPEEFTVSTYRLLGWQEKFSAIGLASREMGQTVGQAPSPAGWSDKAEDWLGPDAMWKRVEWASLSAQRAAAHLDARQLADDNFGERLSQSTRQGIARAESPKQALALLLASPEFQRR